MIIDYNRIKSCSSCKQNKSAQDFHRDKTTKDGLKYTCKVCTGKYISNLGKTSANAKAGIIKRNRIKNIQGTFGISVDEYEKLMESNTCGICGANDRRMVLDHCHSSGKIRGALCANCNIGLGHFKDNVDLLNKAIKWLL